MSLPPMFTAGILAVPTSGRKPLNVQYTDDSTNYNVIEETGAASDTITESGAQDDIITEIEDGN